MSLSFRKLTRKEKELLQSELHYWLGRKTKRFVANNAFYITEGNWTEIVLTNAKVLNFINEYKQFKPYSIGLTFGEIKNEKILLALGALREICSYTDKKVMVDATAEQLFLYQRDVLCKSILEYPNHLDKGKKVLVANEQNDCLGIGLLLCSKDDCLLPQNSEEKAIKNLKDLGWYLRKGR